MWQGFFRGSRRAGFAVVCVGLCVSLALLYPGQLRPVLVDPLGLCMACAWADDTMWKVGIMANVRTAYYIWTADAGRTVGRQLADGQRTAARHLMTGSRADCWTPDARSGTGDHGLPMFLFVDTLARACPLIVRAIPD